MSEPCEVVESAALAESSCPSTEVVVVAVSTADAASSTAKSGVQPYGVVVSGGDTASFVLGTGYAVAVGTADASSTAEPSTVPAGTSASAAGASSSVFLTFTGYAVSAANASSDVDGNMPFLLESTANATSVVIYDKGGVELLTSTANATSTAWSGLLEQEQAVANATSEVFPTRVVTELVISGAVASDGFTSSTLVRDELLISTAHAESSLQAQALFNALLESWASACSSVWFRNPDATAWLMNTESTAVSWYDNFDFESIAQVGDRTLAVGPEGLYELTGPDDDGVKVRARVKSGFTDFGEAQTKRLDNLYLGYTSEGQLVLTTEVLDSGGSPASYLLEQRPAEAPRNSRITPGKGLWGRYWRLTLVNQLGADFHVHDASVDIAVSPRRI